MEKFYSKSREETYAFAQEYAKTLKSGDTVLLDGDMGAGKTVFAKGVAKGLGVVIAPKRKNSVRWAHFRTI